MNGLEAILGAHFFWLFLAVSLLIFELIAPTQIAIGFSIAAFIVAAGVYLEFFWLSNTLPILLTWVGLAFLSWVFLRVIFKNRATRAGIEKGDVNEYD